MFTPDGRCSRSFAPRVSSRPARWPERGGSRPLEPDLCGGYAQQPCRSSISASAGPVPRISFAPSPRPPRPCCALVLSVPSAFATTLEIAPDSLASPVPASPPGTPSAHRAVPASRFSRRGRRLRLGGLRALVAGQDYVLDRAPEPSVCSPPSSREMLRVRRYRVLPVHLPGLVGVRPAWERPTRVRSPRPELWPPPRRHR